MTTSSLSQLAVGDVISYTLPSSALPADLGKVWHGVIELVAQRIVLVVCTDEGYEGMDETVQTQQIVAVEKKQS